MSAATRPTCCTILAALLALCSCTESGDAYYASVPADDYPQATGPGEVLDPNEAEAARRIGAIIEAHLVRLRAELHEPHLYRDAHAKATGCVDAYFTIRDNVPPRLQQGLFATPGRKFRAIIRFSNSNENPFRSDAEPDGRGMAIKLFDLHEDEHPLTQDPLIDRAAAIAGPKSGFMSLAGQPSQDLIMISYPAFLVADAEAYRRTLSFADADNGMASLVGPVVAVFSLGISGVQSAINTTSLKIANPLSIRYWSMVPYQLGTGPSAIAVKFSARADTLPQPEASPNVLDSNYLTKVMSDTLTKNGTHLIFMIQPRTSEAQSVEDSRTEWPESAAPFYDVADITIPAQNFNTDARKVACEELSYSPWHALPEYRPLGAVNRMRKVIYEAVSKFRRENGN